MCESNEIKESRKIKELKLEKISPFKICFSGTRTEFHCTKKIVSDILKGFLENNEEINVIVGDASGVDRVVAEICKEKKIPYTVFVAEWNKYGRSAGPKRNQRMIDENPDMVICLPLQDIVRPSGTRDTYQRAMKAGIITSVYPI